MPDARPRVSARACMGLLSVALGALLLFDAGSPAYASEGVAHAETEVQDGAGLGVLDRLYRELVDFQRRANAEVATHMNAVGSGESWSGFLLAVAAAFLYGVFHSLGPGHGKFVIMSYFLGREGRVARGLVMAVQMAIVHVIAAVLIVWVADGVLKAGLGVGLAEVPGVRAGSFLLIALIGLYMLYQAIRASFRRSPSERERAATHAHDHRHPHEHRPAHGHHHRRPHAHTAEGGLLALAAGMVPCPGAVLIMLYAVANDMIYPGFLLVAAMSAGIGLTIAVLGVGAILARRLADRLILEAGGGGTLATFRVAMSYAGALVVTAIGLASFVAFLPSG